MKYIGLDNIFYKLNTSKYLTKQSKKSKLHLQVREFLTKHFSLQVLLEEVSIRGFPRNKNLYLDFFMPYLGIVIESSGQQHILHVPHFHKTKSDFLLAKNNDRLKREWAELNGFTLYEFFWNESEEDWRKKLNGR